MNTIRPNRIGAGGSRLARPRKPGHLADVPRWSVTHAQWQKPDPKGDIMTTHETPAPTMAVPIAARSTGGGPALIAAAIGFLVLYLSNDFVVPNLASSALPLPNAPVEEVRAWFAENQLAAVTTGVVQALSVACLAGFVIGLRRIATAAGQATAAARASRWGLAAVGLMMAASGLAWLLAGLAPSASLDTVSVLRSANFIAGGTAHVLTLGVFVVLASRLPGMTKSIRVLAYVAAVPAVLSVASLFFFQGAVFILLGRLLCMVATISAAVSVARRLSKNA